MKKYLLSALALPLLFACSSEDYLDQKATDNDQFAGIEKVDATFSMAESPKMRMDKGSWKPQEGDLWGFAWVGGGESSLTIDGQAWQNHNLIQTDGVFKPQTSIYVGNYFLYRPYDKTTVNIGKINFKSLEEQPLAEGYESDKQPWKDLAKTSINIADKWTNVTKAGTTDAEGTWDNAGTEGHYKLYPATFSNQTGLDLKYTKNNPKFAADKEISGATDIKYTIAKNAEVGAADIYDATVELAGAAKSFTYAPIATPSATHIDGGTYWADKKNLGTTQGFTFTSGAITLKAADAEKGISTGADGNKGWFWFNSLPVTAGNIASASLASTNVTTVLNTSYGEVTVVKSLADCAYVLEKSSATAAAEWMKLAAADNLAKSPKEWTVDGTDHNTFINQYGNHKGKYALEVDFSTGKMHGMHIKSDAQLQKLLKYYIASGKTSTAILNLDGVSAEDKTFKLSKISIALLQTINKTATKVTVQACSSHNTPKIIITQDGQDALGLANAKEVPSLVKVFQTATDVYLSKDCEWTWSGGEDNKTPLATGSNVKSITNEGTLTVKATNVEMTGSVTTLKNAKGATMDITKVTTVKDALTNLGTINVKEDAELRAYDVEITNDATGLKEGEYGVINNYGVVGVSETGGTTGKFNNYGLIDMKDDDAITLLTTNELVSDFDNAFNASSNKMGTVKLPENNPTALVSVNNTAENGFIKYNWDGKTYATPTGIVKYNTIVVDDDITFKAAAPEVQYIEFNGTKTQVVNPTPVAPATDFLSNLKGIMVNAGKSIIIEKTNQIVCANGAFLGEGATVYKGGIFKHNANVSGKTAKNYFGTWSTDQIVKY